MGKNPNGKSAFKAGAGDIHAIARRPNETIVFYFFSFPLMKQYITRIYYNAPTILFRLTRRIRRFLGEGPRLKEVNAEVRRLPWGAEIICDPLEHISVEIISKGAYDICACELLWRLLDRDETAIDVGANIGQMTSLMAFKVGPVGKVIAFEPHPQVCAELLNNVSIWRRNDRGCQIEVNNVALSDVPGEGVMVNPKRDFTGQSQNRGIAQLRESAINIGEDQDAVTVVVTTLDKLLPGNGLIGVIKIDVEAHELQVLKGASHLLGKKLIRDILFEEWNTYPTEATSYLEKMGYTILAYDYRPWGLHVAPPTHVKQRAHPPSYLATIDPARAIQRNRTIGWKCISWR